MHVSTPPAARRARRVAGPVLVALVLVVAGCAYGGTPLATGALEVGDTRVSAAELTDAIDWATSSPAAGQALFGTSLADGSGQPTAAAQRQAGVLMLSLYSFVALLEVGLADGGADTTLRPDQVADAELQVDALAAQAPGMPDSLRSTLVRLVALQGLVVERFDDVAAAPTEAELRALYDESIAGRDDFDGYACASHILVAFDPEALGPGAPEPTDGQVAAALEAIEAAAARIADGEDFATVAAEVSDDTGSARQGGDLGCNPPGVFVPEFEQALEGLEPGEISTPVRTQFGYHLITVRSVGTPPFEEVADQLASQLAQQRSSPDQFLLEVVERGAARTDVVVNPRYGEWDAERLQVVVPGGPSPAPGAAPPGGLLPGL